MNFQVLRRLFWSSRPISWVNTAYPFAASYLVVTGQINWYWLIGTLYFLIPYNLLMYGVNDVFDFESDLNNPRKKGVEGIVLEKRFHTITLWTATLSNIPFLLYLFTAGNTVSSVVLVFVVFMVVAYSIKGLRFKEVPFLDSFTSATHFVGPMLFGLASVGWQSDYLPYVLSFYAWGMASHAFGAVQDIIPDRKGAIASIATVLGARTTVRISATLYLLSCLLLAMTGSSGVVVGLSGLMYVANVLPYWNSNDKTSSTANAGWKRFILLNYFMGFIITIVLLLTNL